ncbi:MAG: ATP-dependent helicase HrpB [Rhodospirillales bacterium]|nr:ATP-dependent helicase HrpB [Rhodospirillales bacterium]
MSNLPIETIIPDIQNALENNRNVVLQAPPGAGKTTRVPLALLPASWMKGKTLLMLEPRRLAARAAARRMAETLGETVGKTVGFRVKGENKVGPDTRIEVVTEGVLTRRIQHDPELKGIGAILFDEFHERSLQADLGLALCLDAQEALRDDLRILIMSATLEGSSVSALLDEAPLITSQGRAFPVKTRYGEAPLPRGLEAAVAATVEEALAQESGSLLVFLPGEGEIRRTLSLLQRKDFGKDILLRPLYGALLPKEQDRAIRPAPEGKRKVVLATDIAETSLTIQGVRVVIDSGLRRAPRFDPRSGMTRLETLRVSQASSIQRQGRAGRTEAGICYRLWPEAQQKGLLPFNAPEIIDGDLAPLVLDLAQWGVADPGQLRWLDTPPSGAFSQAQDLLKDLSALDEQGRITSHGNEMAKLGIHPRLAHMMIKGREVGLGNLACQVAALLEERDIIRLPRGEFNVDLRLRLDVLQGRQETLNNLPSGSALHRASLSRVKEAAKEWTRKIKTSNENLSTSNAGRLIALAFPDRVGERRGKDGTRFRLSNGRGATLNGDEPLAAEPFLAIANLDGAGRNARIYQAAPISKADIEELFTKRINEVEEVSWDDRKGEIISRWQRRFHSIVLDEKPLKKPSDEKTIEAVIAGIRKLGLSCLPWTKELRNWQARVLFLRNIEKEEWPDVGEQALLDDLENWLAPFLTQCRRKTDFATIDLNSALKALLDWNLQKQLDEQVPTHCTVPSGSVIPLDYTTGETPILAVRLQEMFGLTQTPSIAGGKVPLLIHLLSPAGRPLQVTQDLAGFWQNSYHAVKADMKGRYPKHPWPDDPLSEPPTNRVKHRRK